MAIAAGSGGGDRAGLPLLPADARSGAGSCEAGARAGDCVRHGLGGAGAQALGPGGRSADGGAAGAAASYVWRSRVIRFQLDTEDGAA